VFGFLAVTVACYYGMNSGRGAQGVGAATKGSVQTAAVLILAANFVLTGLFFAG
jgi:phospholipid/cholesterol/gamma-HCH transport system permease protein